VPGVVIDLHVYVHTKFNCVIPRQSRGQEFLSFAQSCNLTEAGGRALKPQWLARNVREFTGGHST
jgi:hypothetical protein